MTATDPNNTEWQRDLARCALKIGELLLKTGEKSKAAENFEIARRILEKLAAASPENARIRRNLETVVKYQTNGFS